MRINRLLSIAVRGREHGWHFRFYGNPKDIPEWRSDGLEVFEIENSVPTWAVEMGLTRLWCFIQDLWNLKNPFAA